MKNNRRFISAFFSVMLTIAFVSSFITDVSFKFSNHMHASASSEKTNIITTFETVLKFSNADEENPKLSNENEIYYTDLFFGYPYYLSNEYASNYVSTVRDGYSSILSGYTDTDLFFSALETASSDAWEVLINSAWTSVCGEQYELSSSLKNKAIDNATLDIMSQLYSNNLSDNFFSTSSEVNKAVSCFKDLLSTSAIAGGMDGLKAIDESMIVTEVADAFPNINASEIERFIKVSKSNEIVGKFKAGEVIDFVENVDLSIKILATYALIYEVSLAEIDTLMGTVDSDTLFYESLSRIRKKVSGNFATFAIEEIKKDKSLDAVVGFCDKLSLSLVTDSQLATLIAKMIIKAGTWLTFDIIYPVADAEELLTATYLSQMTQEIETAITEKKIKFSGMFTSSDIVEYEMLYEAYIGMILATLSSTKACCKNDADEALIDTYIKSFSNFSYEGYIQSCKNLVLNTPIDERVTRQVIESQYAVSNSNFDILPASDEVVEGKIYLFDGKVLHGIILPYNFKFTNNVVIDGEVNISTGNIYVTIPEGIEVTINGDLTTEYTNERTATISYFPPQYGYLEIIGRLNVYGNLKSYHARQIIMENEKSYLFISGDMNTLLSDTTNSRYNSQADYSMLNRVSNGTIEVQGSIATFNLPDSSNNTLILSGDKQQTLSKKYGKLNFDTIIINNQSEYGVSFDVTINVNKLFNHDQNNFTASGTFPDYDGDGLNDNVDPYPLVGDACTITILSEDGTKGTVSESIEVTGGTEVTIYAVANDGYEFAYWMDNNSNVISESPTYTFVAKSGMTLTAFFVEKIESTTTETTTSSTSTYTTTETTTSSTTTSTATETTTSSTSTSTSTEITTSSTTSTTTETTTTSTTTSTTTETTTSSTITSTTTETTTSSTSTSTTTETTTSSTTTTLPQTGYSVIYNYIMLAAAAMMIFGIYAMAKSRKRDEE